MNHQIIHLNKRGETFRNVSKVLSGISSVLEEANPKCHENSSFIRFSRFARHMVSLQAHDRIEFPHAYSHDKVGSLNTAEDMCPDFVIWDRARRITEQHHTTFYMLLIGRIPLKTEMDGGVLLPQDPGNSDQYMHGSESYQKKYSRELISAPRNPHLSNPQSYGSRQVRTPHILAVRRGVVRNDQ